MKICVSNFQTLFNSACAVLSNIHSAMPQTPRQTRTPSPVRGPRECPGAPKRARSVRPTPVSATVYRSLFNEFEAVDAAAARAACETEA